VPGPNPTIIKLSAAVALSFLPLWHSTETILPRIFLWSLLFRRGGRLNLLRSAFACVRDLVAVATLLDLISQFFIFREIHPGAALLLGPVLIAVPYAVARALTNRITRLRTYRGT
jgi:hypothetical protein